MGSFMVYFRKLTLFVFILDFIISMINPIPTAVGAAPPLACGTTIMAHIGSDTTWTIAGSPYCLGLAELTIVQSGITLTIQSGVSVIVQDQNGGLDVRGTLDAAGLQSEQVIFTSDEAVPQPGDWSGIWVKSTAQVQMEYTDVGYAGRNLTTAILVESELFELNNSRVHHSLGRGLTFSGSNGLAAIVTENLFEYNQLEAIIEIPGGSYQRAPLYSGNILSNNAQDVLALSGGTLAFNRVLDSKHAIDGSSYLLLESGLVINSTSTLTVTAGTTVQFKDPAGGLQVFGGLAAEGLPNQRVIFTTDDQVMDPGDWGRIQIAAAGQASMAYCDIFYGGGGAVSEALLIESSNVQMSACRIQHSLGDAVRVSASSPTRLDNNVITDSIGSGLRLSGATIEALHNTLSHNAVGLLLEGSSTAVLTNTMIAGNTLGVSVEAGSLVTLTRTLFDSNSTNTSGSVTNLSPIYSPAALSTDDYHLTYTSGAIDLGDGQALISDIDGDPRPIGHAPDIGADEYYDALAVYDNLTGGVLDYEDAEGFVTEVYIPVGAFSEMTTLAVKRSEAPAMPVESSYPILYDANHVFDLEAFQNNLKLPGLIFNTYLIVVIDYSDADVAGLDENSLRLFNISDSTWNDASCGVYTREPSINRIIAQVCRPGTLMLAEPDYRIYLPLLRR